jgi:transposase InsO family protein
LYVILDIFSRQVVGWRLADQESAKLAEPLIEDATTFCRRFSPGTTMTTVTAASG